MKKSIILFTTIILLGIQSFGQSSKINGISRIYEKTDSINTQGDTLYNIKTTIYLLDTTNITKVVIKIGNTYQGSDVLNGVFNWYNNTLSSPSNIAYTRIGNKIKFTLHAKVPNLYYYQTNTKNFQSVLGTPYIRQQ